jgi:hypothetical protein
MRNDEIRDDMTTDEVVAVLRRRLRRRLARDVAVPLLVIVVLIGVWMVFG